MPENKKNQQFIDEPIQVGYETEPLLKRVPQAPDLIYWRGLTYKVERIASQWSDLARRGQKSRNMRPSHLQRAEKLGSWGVGRFYFDLIMQDRRRFVIYYDRAGQMYADQHSGWVLFYEVRNTADDLD